MKFLTATALLALASLAASNPIAVSANANSTSSTDGSIEERTAMWSGLYICKDDNWGGLCKHSVHFFGVYGIVHALQRSLPTA